MKIRVKFSKTGPVKFIGHLDTMRYFQKAVRRAKLPASFTEGFSPHMKMSFASPLGVGMTSDGEYFDLELEKEMPVQEITSRLNLQMAEGFSVLDTVRIAEDKKQNAMALVWAADYLVWFREGKEPAEHWEQALPGFLSQERILITKTGKTGQPREVDIKPFLFEVCVREGRVSDDTSLRQNGIFMRLASASSNYTRPDQVIDAFFRYLNAEPLFCSTMIHRLELYALQDGHLAPLNALGEAGSGETAALEETLEKNSGGRMPREEIL